VALPPPLTTPCLYLGKLYFVNVKGYGFCVSHQYFSLFSFLWFVAIAVYVRCTCKCSIRVLCQQSVHTTWSIVHSWCQLTSHPCCMLWFEPADNTVIYSVDICKLYCAVDWFVHVVIQPVSCCTSCIQYYGSSVIFVLTYFLVLVLVFQLFLSFSLVSVLHYFFVSVFVFDFIML